MVSPPSLLESGHRSQEDDEESQVTLADVSGSSASGFADNHELDQSVFNDLQSPHDSQTEDEVGSSEPSTLTQPMAGPP